MPISVEENKAAINRLVKGFWDEGKAEVLGEVFAPNFVNRTPMPGSGLDRASLKQTIIMFRGAFSDGHTTVHE